jgi:hypothetical protein
MMRTLVIAVCVVAGMAASPIGAADKWANATAVLKHATPPIRAGKSGSIPSLFQVGWPANVLKTDGTWALLSGTPGFQKNAEIGWIRVYDLVNGSDDPTSSKDSQYYTARINESQDYPTRATWYWLRGVYWDTNSDTRAAIKDYALAILDLDNPTFFSACKELANLKRQEIEASATPPEEPSIGLSDNDRNALLSDCYRRLGTGLAGIDPVCKYDCWKNCFPAAEQFLPIDGTGQQPTAPRLYYEWGNAYVSALSALIGPGASPGQACTLPADLDDKHKPTLVPTVFQRARDRLHAAVLRDPRFADAFVALGDLESTYSAYFTAQVSAAKKELKESKAKIKELEQNPSSTSASQIKELQTTIDKDTAKIQEIETNKSAVKAIELAAVHYRDAIQDDSGSNKGYLGRSNALQQLAFFIASESLKKSGTATVTCDKSQPTGCNPSQPNAKNESTANPSAASAQTQASSGKTTTTKPAAQTSPPNKPVPCPCCVIATQPDPASQPDPPTGATCPANDPPPQAVICQLALANSQCSPKSDVTEAFANVSSLLAAAADSAQSALSTKDLSDSLSVMQLATTLRDLALLNDATPTVAFQYAASAFNLASNGVEFAAKIEDANSLRSLADKMQKLYECYDCMSNPKEETRQQKNMAAKAIGQSPNEAGSEMVHFYSAPRQFNYSRIRTYGRRR